MNVKKSQSLITPKMITMLFNQQDEIISEEMALEFINDSHFFGQSILIELYHLFGEIKDTYHILLVKPFMIVMESINNSETISNETKHWLNYLSLYDLIKNAKKSGALWEIMKPICIELNLIKE